MSCRYSSVPQTTDLGSVFGLSTLFSLVSAEQNKNEFPPILRSLRELNARLHEYLTEQIGHQSPLKAVN